MLRKLKNLFMRKPVERSLEDRLFASILLPSSGRDDFRWPFVK